MNRPVGQIRRALRHVNRGNSQGLTGGLCGQGTGMTLKGERVLIFTGNIPALGHLLRGEAHAVGNPDGLIGRKECRVERGRVPHHRHHTHRFGPPSEHHIGLANPNPIRRHRNGT